MKSYNPATGAVLWEGANHTKGEITSAIAKAHEAFAHWGFCSFEERVQLLERYAENLKSRKSELAELISQETGKPLWESITEVAAMIQKVPISIQAYRERCPFKSSLVGTHQLQTAFRPHGVIAVFGPYNFPGHLPNGHIVPALLAGNTVLFKPSELTPAVGEAVFNCFKDAGFAPDIIQLVQGGPQQGQWLAESPDLDGLFFTGSAQTGTLLNERFAKTPGKILALEMGGNNPLIVSHIDNISAAAYLAIQSAFLTSGQRCSAARRLILPNTPSREPFIQELLRLTQSLQVGPYTNIPEPFMGPLIDQKSADKVLHAYHQLVEQGAIPLIPLQQKSPHPFLTASILDVTPLQQRPDEEHFGPLLQLIRVESLAEAIHEANQTQFGLTAGLFSNSEAEWNEFYLKIRAGIINWNTPLTGASSQAPFGGLGNSGNHRPSAYLAADYCSYPVASMQSPSLALPSAILPGVALQ